MTTSTHVVVVAGAATASGATVVIDTFRASTTAAVPFDRDVDRFAFAMEAVPGPDRLIRLVARTPTSDGV